MKTKIMLPILMILMMIASASATTNYAQGDKINLWVAIVNNSNGQPIHNATCLATIYDPNNTIWASNISMPEAYDGIYQNTSYNASIITGIYTYVVNCTTLSGNQVLGSTFQVGDSSSILSTGVIMVVMFLMFGILALYLSGVLVESMKHPIRAVAWICMLTSVLFGIANGVINPNFVNGIEFVFYALIMFEMILFTVDVIWIFRQKRKEKRDRSY